MKSIFKSRQGYKNYFYIISFKINFFFQKKAREEYSRATLLHLNFYYNTKEFIKILFSRKR